ncbi:hypothetical protein [Micromonospora sediminicola]|uniref:hypothetical protein n=1 Tax=Micromonospora sediminicola TaxID=946078 RepID=UPI0037AFD464
MAYVAKVEIRRHKFPPSASCESCDNLPTDATRERVRQHVAATGHTAWVVVEDQTMYRPKNAEVAP